MEKLALMIWLAMLCGSIAATARPNWGCVTDGRRILNVSGDADGHRFSLSSADTTAIGLSLTQQHADLYTVDSLPEGAAIRLPEGLLPGDTAVHCEQGFFFFPGDGRPAVSLKKIESWESPAGMRRFDTMAIISGYYPWKGNTVLLLKPDVTGPRLVLGRQEEDITFESDVVADGRTLLHIKTASRRWLLECEAMGLTIYEAAWDKKTKAYRRGRLVRRLKLQMLALPTDLPCRFDYAHYGMPLLDILTKYYSRASVQRLADELQAVAPDSPVAKTYVPLLQRAAEGMKTE